MKKTLLLAALALGALAFAAIADEPTTERKIHLKIMADDDLLDLDLSDLEIGESQQLYTDSGKQVVITRTDEAFEIEIEGRDEPIIVRAGEHAYAFAVESDCDDGEDCLHNVFVNKRIHVNVGEGEAEGSHSMVFMSDDGEVHHFGEGEGHHWVSAGEGEGHGMHMIHLGGGEAAAERLLASGALDDLDEAKRQEILDALRAGEGHGGMTVEVIEEQLHEEQ